MASGISSSLRNSTRASAQHGERRESTSRVPDIGAFLGPLARLSEKRRSTPLLYLELTGFRHSARLRIAARAHNKTVLAQSKRLAAAAMRDSIGSALRRSDIVAAGPGGHWFSILLVGRSVPPSRRPELGDADLGFIAGRLRSVVARALAKAQRIGRLPAGVSARIGWTVIEPVHPDRAAEELNQAIRGAAVVARVEERRATILASITHELRTPLTSIVGYAEMLATGGATRAKRGRYARIIADEARRLRELVDGLIDLGAWSAGKLDLRTRRLSLRSVANAARDSVEPLARARTVRCSVSGDARMLGDKGRLHQMLVNVLDNAVRHSPVGGHVSVEIDSANGTRRLTVSDEGDGFDRRSIEALGLPFARGEGGRTGLGLAIVRLLVEAHGGHVTADNPPNGGGRIRIVFPASRPGNYRHIPVRGAGANKRL